MKLISGQGHMFVRMLQLYDIDQLIITAAWDAE